MADARVLRSSEMLVAIDIQYVTASVIGIISRYKASAKFERDIERKFEGKSKDNRMKIKGTSMEN